MSRKMLDVLCNKLEMIELFWYALPLFMFAATAVLADRLVKIS